MPKYRGASPIQWAIANGDTETGVTILSVSKEMDAGDMLMQERLPIADDDTTESLKVKLAGLGAELITQTLRQVEAGTAESAPQDESQAVYVTKLTKADGRIDWAMSAREIDCRVRGFYPWPGCYCPMPGLEDEMLKIMKLRVEAGEGEPGEVLEVDGDGALIATGEGAVRLLMLQPPGKRPMSGSAFLCGHSLATGAKLR